MATPAQFSVLGPLKSGVETRAFLGCEVVDGVPRPDRPVVIVWLPDDVVSDPKQVARLQRETAFVTQLDHPNIIGVRGLECFEEGWARVVDFVDGEPLIRVLARAREEFRPLDPRVAARMVVDVCEAVSYAHEEGQARFAGRPVVHGGLRPDTLMVTFSGRTTVTGYGASVLAPTQHGTPVRDKFVYFAPEQIIGGKATASPATDIYAIGALLYELLAGKPPFSDADDLERAVLTGEPPILDAPGLAGRLGNVAATALAKRGSERFETVEVMRDAILDALAQEDAELASHAEVETFVNALIPPDSPERVNRRELLESAEDPEVATLLSSASEPPEGVDPSLYARARPVSALERPPRRRDEVTQANGGAAAAPALRRALPREVDTVIEAPRDLSGPVPVGMDEDELTQGRRPRPDAVTTESTAAAALPVAPAPAVSAPPPTPPQPRAAPPSLPSFSAPPQGGLTPPAAPAGQPGLAPTAQAGLTAPAQGLPPQAGLTAPAKPGYPPGYAPPQVGLTAPAQPGYPPGYAPPQAGLTAPAQPGYPPGYAPPQAGLAAPAQPGYPPGYAPPQAGLTPPAARPQAAPMPPAGVPPGYPQPPYAPPPGYPQAMPPGAYPPGAYPPPGYPSAAPGPGWPGAAPSAFPPGHVPPGTMPPQGAPTPGTGRPTPRGFVPPAARAAQAQSALPAGSAAPRPTGTPGNFLPTGAPGPRPDLLANAPVTGLPPAPPKKSSAVRENSQVTQFNKRMGDSSRSVVFLVLAVAVAALAFIFVSKEPPKGLDAPPERHTLPKELVQAALQNAGKDNVEVLDDGAGQAEEAAAAALDGGVADSAVVDPDAPPAPPAPGHLQITSEPEVSVFLGKDDLGRTPVSVKLPPGRHRLRFTDAETGINSYKTFRVRAGANHHHELRFGTSQLVVLAPEGATISLNVRKLGTAPLEPVTIYEGEYLLKVTFEGMSWSERFDAPPGQRIEYKVNLK
jgi:serine/threonine protein kinase